MKKLLLISIIIIILIISFLFFKNNYQPKSERIVALTFHKLVPDNIKKTKYQDNMWVGSIDDFSEMMEYLSENNYKTISSEELSMWLDNKIDLPKKTVMITFDDGFYEDYYLVYPILKKYNFKAISFVVGSRIEKTTLEYNENTTGFIGYDKIVEIRNDYPNFEIQSHSYDLHYYNSDKKHIIKKLTKEELLNDILSNSKYDFNVMAYPFGDYNNDIKELLKDNNYILAFRFTPSSYITKDSERYALPRVNMSDKKLKDLKKWLNY